MARLGVISLGETPKETSRQMGQKGAHVAILAQMCQLAVAVPGVPGECQGLHFVKGEAAGQLGEPVALQVSSLQHGHTSKCIVCKLKHKGL